MQRLKDHSMRITGSKQVLRAAMQGNLEICYIALDADPYLLQKIKTACAEQDIPVETVPSMKELGVACCIEVKAAAAGILKS